MTTALIEKFFRKECTPAEASEVALYLKANPEMLEKYVGKEEWENAVEQYMPPEFWKESWAAIQRQNKLRLTYIYIKRATAIAACLALIITAVWLLYPKQKPAAGNTIVAVESASPQPQFITNTSAQALKIVLEDSSVIKLEPASSVHYLVPFAKDKREIYLEGEAWFRVSKNKQKPFTVFAAGLATTALGTSFKIKTNTKTNAVSVQLFTGKVVIKEVQDFKAWTKDIYLLPGEQLRFNKNNMLIAVEKIKDNNTTSTMIALKKPAAVLRDTANTALSFNNSNLPEVFDKLSAFYKVKIQYDTALIDTLHFTGVVMKSDSMAVILNVITHMNNLQFLKNENAYIILKQDQH